MDNFSTMKILECPCNLVDDEANVNIFEYILGDNVVEVCFYELKNKVDVPIIICLDSLVEFNYVGMV